MGARGCWLLPIGMLLLGACSEDTEPPPSARNTPEPELPMLASVRRPTEQHVMIRTGERCEIVVELGLPAGEELIGEYACPVDLELGESIRMLGKTCTRDSPNPARALPVVCPATLARSERYFRERETTGTVRRP